MDDMGFVGDDASLVQGVAECKNESIFDVSIFDRGNGVASDLDGSYATSKVIRRDDEQSIFTVSSKNAGAVGSWSVK